MSKQPQECATGSMKIAARSLPCFLTSASAISSSLNGATIVFAAFSGKAPAETGIAFISFDDPNCSGDGLTDSASSSCQPWYPPSNFMILLRPV